VADLPASMPASGALGQGLGTLGQASGTLGQANLGGFYSYGAAMPNPFEKQAGDAFSARPSFECHRSVDSNGRVSFDFRNSVDGKRISMDQMSGVVGERAHQGSWPVEVRVFVCSPPCMPMGSPDSQKQGACLFGSCTTTSTTKRSTPLLLQCTTC
jgi:hypothetical protein